MKLVRGNKTIMVKLFPGKELRAASDGKLITYREKGELRGIGKKGVNYREYKFRRCTGRITDMSKKALVKYVYSLRYQRKPKVTAQRG